MFRPLMIQGCTSNAGKSYLVSGFCRLYANRGFKVAPFKAQNMSNNAGVTAAGLEMGRAQFLQAQAARVTADTRMNPVLIKPEGNTKSQLVLKGVAQPSLSDIPWMERKPYLWASVQESLHSLVSEFDLIIMEGAGSPAEINLKAGDIVNMRAAKEVQASVLLAADIDRGGAFAHLLGTWHCLDDDEKSLMKGFLLNKFRGDPALLGNAMDWLEQKTTVPTLGIVPMLRLPLPEEDAFSLEPEQKASAKAKIAIVMTPFISNFDEFDSLIHEPNVSVQFVKEAQDLEGAAAVILAGSKHVFADLAYLRSSGIAAKIHDLADKSVPIMGVCGGFQMLGKAIHDPAMVEGGGSMKGLALLDVETQMHKNKTTKQTTVRTQKTAMPLKGYEIHHGQTKAFGRAKAYLENDLGFMQGNILGVYVHGLFDNAGFRADFLKRLGVSANPDNWHAQVDASLDTLAHHLETHCNMAAIDKALGIE